MTPTKSAAKPQRIETFTELEVVSLSALMGYVAHNRGIHEEFLRKMILNHFTANTIEELPRNLYDTVVRYIVDLPANNR